MKQLFLKTLFLALVLFMPVSVMAQVSVQVRVPLPPPIIFPAPPEMVVIPETYVYAVPDVQEEIFFYDGWWWRPWEGRWYRSRYYDRGWGHYHRAPRFYANIHPGWRDDYRNHMWRGHRWEHRPIPHRDLQRNWHGWQRNKHWERQQTWGVQGLPPRRHPPAAVRHQPPSPRHDAQPPRHVQPQPRPQHQGELGRHNAPPPPREVRPQQPRPVQSREMNPQGRRDGGADIKKDRRPAGEANRQGRHEKEPQERGEKR